MPEHACQPRRCAQTQQSTTKRTPHRSIIWHVGAHCAVYAAVTDVWGDGGRSNTRALLMLRFRRNAHCRSCWASAARASGLVSSTSTAWCDSLPPPRTSRLANLRSRIPYRAARKDGEICRFHSDVASSPALIEREPNAICVSPVWYWVLTG